MDKIAPFYVQMWYGNTVTYLGDMKGIQPGHIFLPASKHGFKHKNSKEQSAQKPHLR